MSILTRERSRSGKRTPYAKTTSFFRKLNNQIESEKLNEKKFIRSRANRDRDEEEMV